MPGVDGQGEWAVEEGAVDAPTSRVTVAPDRVVALITRGIALADAMAALTFGGAEPDLARNALALTTPLLTG